MAASAPAKALRRDSRDASECEWCLLAQRLRFFAKSQSVVSTLTTTADANARLARIASSLLSPPRTTGSYFLVMFVSRSCEPRRSLRVVPAVDLFLLLQALAARRHSSSSLPSSKAILLFPPIPATFANTSATASAVDLPRCVRRPRSALLLPPLVASPPFAS